MAQRVLFGAFGSSSGTTPLPWLPNTPDPTCTDDLLPVITLGCGEELDRVRSDQMIASSESSPRRPSSHESLMVTDLRQGASGMAEGAKANRKHRRPPDAHLRLRLPD